MAQPLDRATRKIVMQYSCREFGTEALDNPTINQVAPEAIATLERLLDECNTAEVNAARGRTAMVTVGRIRQLIAEGLS